MHELSIAGNIAEMVRRETSDRELLRIEAITVRIGRMTDVNPDALTFGFEVITRDSELAGTKLIIEQVPAAALCKSCDQEFEIPGLSFTCPNCGANSVEVIRGMELDIISLEVTESASVASSYR